MKLIKQNIGRTATFCDIVYIAYLAVQERHVTLILIEKCHSLHVMSQPKSQTEDHVLFTSQTCMPGYGRNGRHGWKPHQQPDMCRKICQSKKKKPQKTTYHMGGKFCCLYNVW